MKVPCCGRTYTNCPRNKILMARFLQFDFDDLLLGMLHPSRVAIVTGWRFASPWSLPRFRLTWGVQITWFIFVHLMIWWACKYLSFMRVAATLGTHRTNINKSRISKIIFLCIVYKKYKIKNYTYFEKKLQTYVKYIILLYIIWI